MFPQVFRYIVYTLSIIYQKGYRYKPEGAAAASSSAPEVRERGELRPTNLASAKTQFRALRALRGQYVTSSACNQCPAGADSLLGCGMLHGEVHSCASLESKHNLVKTHT